MAVIGIAEVLVQPSFKGVQSKVGKEMAGIASQEGTQAGSTMGQKLGGALKGAAVVGAGAAMAGIGVALTKGFGRLQAIENARAKLSGLGHDAKTVESIMVNANAAVKGTAFGLGDAASAAASAVASGVKPGADLERTLKLTGDAATIAGVEFGDMSAIMNKAAASNKVQGEILAQLGDQGIPIVQLLGKEMGLTAAEVFKAGEKGEITFDHLRNAIENGMGGAALESGKTLTGAFNNTMAAVGRIGANLMSNIYPQVTGFFTGMIDHLKPLEEQAKVIGTAIGDALAGMVKWFEENKSTIQGLIPVVGVAVAGITAYFAITKTMAAFKAIQAWYLTTTVAQKGLNAAMRANPIGTIITAITLLVGALVWLYQNNETARNIMQGAWKGIQNAISFAWNSIIKPAFDAIVGFVKNVLAPAFSWFWNNIIKPVWSAIQSAIGFAWNKIIKPIFAAIKWYIDKVVAPVFQWLYNTIIKPIWTAISTAVKIAWGIIETIFLTIKWTLQNVLGPVFTWLHKTIVKPVFDAIGAAIKWAWNNVIKPVFDTIKRFIDNTLAPVFRWFRDHVIKPVWDGISKTVKDVWNNNIKPIFQALGKFIENTVVPAFRRGVQAIKDIWNGIRNAAAAPINFVIDTVYNNGLRKALNKVRKVVGGDELPPLAKIPEFGQKRSTSSGPMRAFAKGGFAAPGWALVGEEGPELVNFSNPGRVYTADQSQKMLGAGHGPKQPAMGGWAADAWDAIKAGAKKATDWVRGGLASAAGLLLNPIKKGLSALLPDTGLGDIAKRASTGVIDSALDWIRGKDKMETKAGSTAAVFDGPLGSFHRPSRGPYTSFFGPRPGFGDYHTGVDIAGGGPTFAALNGIVSQIGNDPVGGIFIRLNHGKGFSTYYGHNPVGGPKVNVGQQVKAGQAIGQQGMTGLATGVHVHFQTEKGGRPVDPMAYLHDNGGVLNPGLSTILNRTGKPEAILNNQQWKDIHSLAMARNNPASSAPSLVVQGDVLGASAHQIVDVLETKRRREMTMANLNSGMRV